MPKTKGSVIRKAWPTVKIVSKHGKPTYQVDARPTDEGRRFFPDKAEAVAFAEELAKLRDDGGSLALAMPAALRQNALEAAEILAPWNRTLVEAARHYAGFLNAEASKADAITVEAATSDYLATKRQERDRAEIAPSTFTELESKLRIIGSAFADVRVIDIDQTAIQKFLEGLHHRPRGRANIRTKLSQLLNHCRRRGWILANPAELTNVRVPPRDVAILTVSETAKLLHAAESNIALLPYVCLGLFAGLRPGEAQQLLWTDIHFESEQIEIRPEITKTRQRRFVPLESMLSEWLLSHRQPNGGVVGKNFTKNWRGLRKAAGLEVLSSKRPWQDILRHTYATYWLALHTDRPRLAENLGNSVDVVRTFYRRAVQRTLADKFWQLRPSKRQQSKIVAFAAES